MVRSRTLGHEEEAGAGPHAQGNRRHLCLGPGRTPCKVRSARAQRMHSACSWCRSVIVCRSGRLLCGGGGECRCVACVSVCVV
eukprot:scaffold264898_cov66-Attheya_sp.AAC.1